MFPHADCVRCVCVCGFVNAVLLLLATRRLSTARKQLEMAREHGLPVILSLGGLLKTPEIRCIGFRHVMHARLCSVAGLAQAAACTR